jgi:hypothetical protein
MTTYYRLELLDGDVWIPHNEPFTSPEAASAYRDKVIADPDQWAYYLIVEQGCRTQIVEMQVTERVVREFPGLPVEDEA